MGETIRLKAADGHEFDAWLVRPAGAIKGGIVVSMEMYGVNNYLKAVCQRYADDGYLCIAPAYFDRHDRGLTLPYDEIGSKRGKELSGINDFDLTLADAKAAADYVRADADKVAIMGYCFGGTVTWLASCKGGFDAAIAYYGSDMCDFPELPARCPTICHVGDLDTAVPPADVKMFQEKRPEVFWHIYPGAQHGFDNWTRAVRYHQEAADLARTRTLAFLEEQLG